jgi:hypothetical protein
VEAQGDMGLEQRGVSWETAKDRVALGQEGEDQKDPRVLGHSSVAEEAPDMASWVLAWDSQVAVEEEGAGEVRGRLLFDRKGSAAGVAGLGREFVLEDDPTLRHPTLVAQDLEEVAGVEVHPIEEQQGHV